VLSLVAKGKEKEKVEEEEDLALQKKRKKRKKKSKVVWCRTLRKPAAPDIAGESSLPGDFLFCYGFEEEYQKAALTLFHLFWPVPLLARCFTPEGFL